MPLSLGGVVVDVMFSELLCGVVGGMRQEAGHDAER
jgi:hypothetical protein